MRVELISSTMSLWASAWTLLMLLGEPRAVVEIDPFELGQRRTLVEHGELAGDAGARELAGRTSADCGRNPAKKARR